MKCLNQGPVAGVYTRGRVTGVFVMETVVPIEGPVILIISGESTQVLGVCAMDF